MSTSKTTSDLIISPAEVSMESVDIPNNTSPSFDDKTVIDKITNLSNTCVSSDIKICNQTGISHELPNNTSQSDNTLSDTSIIKLTPSQENVSKIFPKLISEFKILVVRGDGGSGKYTVIREIFKRMNSLVEHFDLCKLAKDTKREVSNQDVIVYLENLRDKLVATLGKDQYGIIYMRHYNRIADILTDCYAKLRFLLPLILKTFSESLPDNIRIVMTTHGCLLPEGLHWCIDLSTTRDDMKFILTPFCDRGIISQSEFEHIMNISKIVPIGRILHCMKYATAMTSDINVSLRDRLENIDNIFLESYKKALSKFSGSIIDIDKDVPKIIPADDLVGVEDIMDEINTSIINPMKLGIPEISIKKGLLICGPPGTGKTNIGRWLAQQINGKFYLIGGEAGINGSSLIDKFESMVKRAHENAPAVVFIDDGDVLFDQDDTYRAFLTILDGIETNKRSDVCVIMTCMNMRKVPSSLLRGGRLEMALITRLPDRNKIQIILERSMDKMQTVLNNYDESLAADVNKYITKSFIGNIAVKMCGWNCADIQRCVYDVYRLIFANKGANLLELFDKCIGQIRQQYILCGRCESTNLDDRSQENYIS